jgi:hypothetical protein
MAEGTRKRSSAVRPRGANGQTPFVQPAQSVQLAPIAAQEQAPVRVRSYCQGIGDCHLLRFPKEHGGFFWILIDCGVHSSIEGGTEKIDRIVEDIAKQTDGKLDVIVLTHEHWDHNSGFKTAQERFSKFTVDEIWMAWTENPKDLQATKFDKFKGDALEALRAAQRKFETLKSGERTLHLKAINKGLQHLLAFNFNHGFGVKGDEVPKKDRKKPGVKGRRVRGARELAIDLVRRHKGAENYLDPSTPPFSLKDVSDVRVYVLGPPRDPKMFGITERPGEMYGMRSAESSAAVRALMDPLKIANKEIKWWDDFTSPFRPERRTLLFENAEARREDQE